MDKLTRRAFLRASGFAGAAVLLAACGPATTTTPAAGEAAPAAGEGTAPTTAPGAAAPAGQEPVTVEWWPGWPNPFMTTVGELFMAANPGIKLNMVLNYPEKEAVLAAVASDTTPDLIEDVPYMELIVRGVFMPIDERLANVPDLAVKGGDIPDSLWEVFAWEGQHYGIPSVDTAGREGFGINLTVAEEAGLDVNNLPVTWSEAFEWHKKITQYDAAGNVLMLGFDPMAERTDACTDGDPWMWPHLWGFAYIKDGVYDIDRPETVEFLTVIKQFADDVGIEKIDGLNTAFAAMNRGPFDAGKVGMRITYPSAPAETYRVNPDHKYVYTYCPVPDNRRGIKVQTAGGHAGCIMAQAAHPDEAFELAKFLVSPEACEVFFKEVGWVGPRLSWQQTLDLSTYPDHVAQSIRYFSESLTKADEVWWNNDPIEGITADEWNRVFEGVRHGELTPEQGAKEMQEKLTKELAPALEER
ncbi:MAG: substrate-binding domain-containing protein [Anaerolineales bacterium]